MAMMVISIISSCEKDSEENPPNETLKGTSWHSPEDGNASAETLKFTTDKDGIKISAHGQDSFTYTYENNEGNIDFGGGKDLVKFTISSDKLSYGSGTDIRDFNKCTGECPEIGGDESTLESLVGTYWYNPTASDGYPVKLYFVDEDYSFYLGTAIGVGFDFTYSNPSGTLENFGPMSNYALQFDVSEDGRELTIHGDEEITYKIIDIEAAESSLESLVNTAWLYTFDNYKETYVSYSFTSDSEGEIKDNGETLPFTYTYSNPHVSITFNDETQSFTVLDGVMAFNDSYSILAKVDIADLDQAFKDGNFSLSVNDVTYTGNYVINTDDKFSIRQFIAANDSFSWSIQQDDNDFQLGSTFDIGEMSYCFIDFDGNGEITTLEIVSGTITVNSENMITIDGIYKDNSDNNYALSGTIASHVN